MAKIVVLAVKPHLVNGVLEEIWEHVGKQHLIVSIAAGRTIDSMQSLLGEQVRLARLTVNTPALVLETAGAFSMGKAALP